MTLGENTNTEKTFGIKKIQSNVDQLHDGYLFESLNHHTMPPKSPCSQSAALVVIAKDLQLKHAARTVGQRGRLVTMGEINGSVLSLLMASRRASAVP